MLINVGTTFSHIGLIQDIIKIFMGFMDFHNSRSKFTYVKTAAKCKRGHWTSINFASNDWNDLNHVTEKMGILQPLRSLWRGGGLSYSDLCLVVLVSLKPVNKNSQIACLGIVGLREDIKFLVFYSCLSSFSHLYLFTYFIFSGPHCKTLKWSRLHE